MRSILTAYTVDTCHFAPFIGWKKTLDHPWMVGRHHSPIRIGAGYSWGRIHLPIIWWHWGYFLGGNLTYLVCCFSFSFVWINFTIKSQGGVCRSKPVMDVKNKWPKVDFLIFIHQHFCRIPIKKKAGNRYWLSLLNKDFIPILLVADFFFFYFTLYYCLISLASITGLGFVVFWLFNKIYSWKTGFPCGSVGRELACNAGDMHLIPGKIPWRRAWQSTPVFLPGESHGQRSLVGYSPWGGKESDMTEATEHVHTVEKDLDSKVTGCLFWCLWRLLWTSFTHTDQKGKWFSEG